MFENIVIIGVNDSTKTDFVADKLFDDLKVANFMLKTKKRQTIPLPDGNTISIDTFLVCLDYENTKILC